ncbi:MAG: efflux RND transporter permease subunit [Alphaproteobacteria bacterium]|nr:MAG: efflux RND transporter permease subunit [Alphaproteobacteria bacterium]
MRISEICIKRPVLSWVMTFVIFVLGIVGFSRLGVQQYPTLEHPIVTIESNLAGASGSVVENSVTRLIEDGVASIDGIDFIQSNSSLGESKITIVFNKTKSIDRAVDEIRDQLFRLQQDLPKEMPNPSVKRMGGNVNYIISLALRYKNPTKEDNLGPLLEFAKSEIEKELEAIKGVAQVITSGAGLYKMFVYLDPTKLAVNNVSVREVINAIQNHNFELSAGQLKTQEREYTVTVSSNLEKPVQFENITVLEKEGRIIKIRDLGHVEMMPEDRQTRSRFNGQRVISISVLKQSLANPMDITYAIKTKLPEIRKKLSSDMEIDVSFDGTKFIDISVKQVYRTIVEAIIFVTLVILLFLSSFRAALIPLVTIPVSLVGTFFVIYLLGFTINMFSLSAMVLAVGLVVDDAIVVLENIYRYLEKGMKPFEAARVGINEIGFSVVAMTITLAAVYFPTALAQGTTGTLMMEFAITLAISVLISGFVALTLSPMMCARMLKDQQFTRGEERIIDLLKKYIRVDDRLDQLERSYQKTLENVLSIKKRFMFIAILFTLGCFWLYVYIPKNFQPSEDKNTIQIVGEAPQIATLEFTDKYVKMLDDKLAEFPDIEKRDAKVENINRYKIDLTLKDKKTKTTDQLIKDLEKMYATIPGINARISAEDSSDMVQFAIRGNKDVGQLYGYAMAMHAMLNGTGLFKASGGILTSQKQAQEEFIVTIDADKTDALKLDPKSVGNIIKGLMKGEKSTTFRKNNRAYDVMVEIDDQFRKTIDDYLKIQVKLQDRADALRIPLGELINIESKMGYPNILHYRKARMVDVAYKLKPGVGLKECIEKIQDVSAKVLPDDVYLEFIGETKKFLDESYWIVFIFLLALCFIYLVLAAQFESWRDPFIIILSVPLSLAGGILGVLLFFSEPKITLWGNIGFITLIGLITKHGIMMVDFANHLMAEEKLRAVNAIVAACKLRLRPILMTTSAMVLGTVPLLLLSGPTQKANNELGAVIIGGLIVGTILTLFFVPCVYVYFKRNVRFEETNT